MPVLVRNNVTCLFIHIPKTGGSSFERRTEADGWTKSFSINGVPATELEYLRSSPQHFHAAILEKIFFLNKFDEIITIVRNPYDRFKSEYYWLKSSGLASEKPEEWIAESLRVQPDLPFIYDNHLRPQSEFIPAGVDVKIFKLEEHGVDSGLQLLRTHDTKPLSFRWRIHLNRRGWEKRSSYNDTVERVFEEHRYMIEEFYASDYELLGYKSGR